MLILLIIDTDNDRFPAHFIFIRKNMKYLIGWFKLIVLDQC